MKRPSSKFRNTKNSPLRVLDQRHNERADVPTQIVTRQPRFSTIRDEPVPERSALLSSTRIYPKFFNRFQVEVVDVEQLKLPHRKVRKYSTRQLAKLIASIRKFDFIVPILITDDCTVCARLPVSICRAILLAYCYSPAASRVNSSCGRPTPRKA
jgi:hypothetical protein